MNNFYSLLNSVYFLYFTVSFCMKLVGNLIKIEVIIIGPARFLIINIINYNYKLYIKK